MRLTKPAFMTFRPLTCDSRDLCADVIQQLNQSDWAKPPGLDYFPLGDLLLLPQHFGNIFLGETFSSYISVHNDSDRLCRDISLKTDLQTGSQCVSLTSTDAQPIPELLPDHSLDDVVHHDVKELGTHMLVCTVSYAHSTGEKMQFRKFFKFQVLKPLDVKTKFYNAETDEVYLEAQVQNLTTGPVWMDRVSLIPSQHYTAREIKRHEGKEGFSGSRDQRLHGTEDFLDSLTHSHSFSGSSDQRLHGTEAFLAPRDSRQFLYHLSPRALQQSHDCVGAGGQRGPPTVTPIGRLDLLWKGSMGDTGHLQTSLLQRVAPHFGDIRLTIKSIPDTVAMETTFIVVCRVTNHCDRTLDLSLSLHNQRGRGLLWSGLLGRRLGQLPGGASMDLPFALLALTPGLQTISGVRLTDNSLRRTYEHDDFAQVLVVGGRA